jgi:hypothetical protein
MQQPHPTISLRAHSIRLVCGVLEPGAPLYLSEYMAWLEKEILVAFPMDGAQLLAVIPAENQENAKARMRTLERRPVIVKLDDSGVSLATTRAQSEWNTSCIAVLLPCGQCGVALLHQDQPVSSNIRHLCMHLGYFTTRIPRTWLKCEDCTKQVTGSKKMAPQRP